jgi:hypothetical protein
MKIEIESIQGEDRDSYIINAYDENAKKLVELSFFDGEPEDNALCRNFNDVYKIERLVKYVYEAGLRNEKLDIIDI